MAKGYNPTEYMYSSTRLRALEGKLADREGIFKLCDMDSASSVLAALPQYGFELHRSEDGRILREESLMSALEKGFADVGETESKEAVAFLRYRYDCNNIKSVMKCFSAGISPDGMMFSFGSVEKDEVKMALEKEDYSAFPPAMADAAARAKMAFLETGDPQKIDLILDRACFSDMLTSAEKSKISLSQRLVRKNIDLLNIIMCARLIRMELGERAVGLLEEALLDGGELEKSVLADAVFEGEKMLAETVRYRGYEKISDLLEKKASLSALEQQLDSMLMDIVKEAKFTPFGAEIAVGYIMAIEYEIKNIRIILAGKSAGLSSADIRERLRESYV